MHPAASVILFSSLSGLGFGMLFWLGLGLPDVSGFVAFVFFAIAYALAVGGLISSTFHLGHPERALKAFSQWRSSWLSREAWVAVAALIVMAIYAAAKVFWGLSLPFVGVIGAVLSLGVVFTTSKIYNQLKTVPRWHHPLTPAHFLAYALAGGALMAGQVSIALPLLVLAGVAQFALWVLGDKALAQSGTTLATATGLGPNPRAFEAPHTGSNFLTREMVFVIGRKHAHKLRIIAAVLAFGVPVALLVIPFSHAFAAIAVLSHLAGVLTARWLFFAEAEHVVGLYYGKR
jgi:DMSO reductase anchor subunit